MGMDSGFVIVVGVDLERPGKLLRCNRAALLSPLEHPIHLVQLC